jgi:aminoglycoside phosphotransferase (APT) family kinase protein
MDFRPIDREPDAFQQSVSSDEVVAMCRRALGEDVRVKSAVEIGWGAYNSTYRVQLDGLAPVILRVAPEPRRQFRSERELMRNEHAAVPYLAPVGSLLPRTLAVDFTHQIVGRDYLFQTQLDGVPAPEGLAAYARAEWSGFFRQMGAIARRIHDVHGVRFGPVGGPLAASWSSALATYFHDVAVDLDEAGVASDDVRTVVMAIDHHAAVLDQIDQPRLLHGDLWTVNIVIAPAASEPTITGVVDCDRAWWGDPMADWSNYRAVQRPGSERDAFWDEYGAPETTAETRIRDLIYQARHLSAIRLERLRLGKTDELAETYGAMRDLISKLGSI